MKHEEFLKLIERFRQDKKYRVKWLDDNNLSTRMELFDYVKSICNYKNCVKCKDDDGPYCYRYEFNTIGGYEIDFISMVGKFDPYNKEHTKNICRHLDEIRVRRSVTGINDLEEIYSISKSDKNSRSLSVDMTKFHKIFVDNKFLDDLLKHLDFYENKKSYLEDENTMVIIFTINKIFVEIKFRGIVPSLLNKNPDKLKKYSEEILTKITDNIISITIYPDKYEEKDTLINTFIER